MNMEKVFQWLGFSIIIIGMAFLLTWFFLPKSNQGYYLKTNDGYGEIATYRIFTNWDNYRDTISFVTADKEEVIRVFQGLTK